MIPLYRTLNWCELEAASCRLQVGERTPIQWPPRLRRPRNSEYAPSFWQLTKDDQLQHPGDAPRRLPTTPSRGSRHENRPKVEA